MVVVVVADVVDSVVEYSVVLVPLVVVSSVVVSSGSGIISSDQSEIDCGFQNVSFFLVKLEQVLHYYEKSSV